MAASGWSKLEERALEAQQLSGFPINLKEIRDTVDSILSQVGKYGFFDEYTDHGFGHVESMLESAEWIIPSETLSRLTAGDCLFIVLSIYFHDVGLLISRREFARRNQNSEFTKFLNEPPITASKSSEFRARISQLPDDEADRVLYQEFVRYSHGSRIKAWISGARLDDDNTTAELHKIIGDLFGSVDPTFRRDLALVCDSHTRDDISDTAKYKTSQPYGRTAAEWVNLQYVAVVLRTVDLLQITKGRAPSALFQFINPTDPVSQIEWQKQGAVRSVRAKAGVDREGKANPDIQPDTIEVHARFEQPDGFFGLTSYLAYAEAQLQASHAAISKSSRELPHPPRFPWKHFDVSGIEAAGFLTESFGFSLDQQKILDLLTGHTLYNDTTVVLRELTQNSLDAVRLQADIDLAQAQDSSDSSSGAGPATAGKILIHWDTAAKALTVTDNGTGMSQDVIENHLLKVGSSRYQDPGFREKYPEFTSISRFGIGALSAFMVSDDVQITTCSPDDEKARRIALRSVHGKYLIKLLDKVSDREEIGVFPHGTSVRLVLRPMAEIGDVEQIARMWLLFPNCEVSVQIDQRSPISIGYKSPKEALEKYVANSAQVRPRYLKEIDIREVTENGVTLAFAVVKNELFKDWGFVEIPSERHATDREAERPPTAICIGGIGVEFATPGFQGFNILAIANATGPSAPKTNVARSALEDTFEQREMLATIYKLYLDHVRQEIERLTIEESYSLTRAVGEAPYIASPLVNPNVASTRPSLLMDAVSDVELILVESENGRRRVSFNELQTGDGFWTVDSPLSRSIETFIREAPSDITAKLLLETLGNASSAYPSESTICNFKSSEYVHSMLRSKFEVSEVFASESLRRINLKWDRISDTPRWISSSNVLQQVSQEDRRYLLSLTELQQRSRISRSPSAERVNVPIGAIKSSGLEGFGACVSGREYYFSIGEPVTYFLNEKNQDVINGKGVEELAAYLVLSEVILAAGWRWDGVTAELLHRALDSVAFDFVKTQTDDLEGFLAAFRQSKSRIFNPFAWDRRE